MLQVLDRVLAQGGGRRWWAALSGRAKAQRAYNQAAASRQASKVCKQWIVVRFPLLSAGAGCTTATLTCSIAAQCPTPPCRCS